MSNVLEALSEALWIRRSGELHEVLHLQASEQPPSPAENPQLGKLAIIGPDNRKRVTDTTEWPYTVSGKLRLIFPDKQVRVGTGVLIGSRHVLTAGHCLYSKSNGGWIAGARFEPGRNESEYPFGFADGAEAVSVEGWVDHGNSDFDFGILTLTNSIGLGAGFLPVISMFDPVLLQKTLRLSGYPADKPDGQMWTDAGKLHSLSSERVVYELDSYGGQSGAGLMTEDEQTICGIHIGAGAGRNVGVRLTSAKIAFIRGILSG